jgi:hypothetical protein
MLSAGVFNRDIAVSYFSEHRVQPSKPTVDAGPCNIVGYRRKEESCCPEAGQFDSHSVHGL